MNDIHHFAAGDRVEFYTNNHNGRTKLGTVLYTTGSGRYLAVKEDGTGDTVRIPSRWASR